MVHTTAPKTVRTLIAPDKFKGSLTAGEVADALAAGLRAGARSTGGAGAVHCELLPLADGGDGSVDAAVAAGFTRHRHTVTGPTGQPVPAGWISFTPEPGKGSVRVCQIKDGLFDSSKEGEPGIFLGKNLVKIAGFDGKKVPLWGQGKQIFNPIDDTLVVGAGSLTKDFEIPDSAGTNVQVVPTADN